MTRIEILPNIKKDKGLIYTRQVASLLSRFGCDIFLPSLTPEAGFTGVYYHACDEPELVIVLGGDGSVMRASKRAVECHALLLGINLGRVGYLPEVNHDEIPLLEKLFTGEYETEKRMMLSVRQVRKGRTVEKPRLALNDAVVSHGTASRLLETEVYCNGGFAGSYRSDGFVISTPTGSTAYSLSAGGPILDPSLQGLCLVPICPHSLTARPMVVSDRTEVEIRYPDWAPDKNAYLTVDGEEAGEIFPGDSVYITSSDKTVSMVRLHRFESKSFYTRLQEKMTGL